MQTNNEPYNSFNDYQQSEDVGQSSSQHQPKYIPKAKRGRPKKKPGFHLNLEGMNKRPIHNRLISSSQSDSGTDYWNRTPGTNINIHSLSLIPMGSQKERYQNEKELKLSNSYGNNNHSMIPSFNLTPSVEPPIVGYFDQTPKGTDLNAGGFFSPAINEKNAFNQTFEEYLKELENGCENLQNETKGVDNKISNQQLLPTTEQCHEHINNYNGTSSEQQQQQQQQQQPQQHQQHQHSYQHDSQHTQNLNDVFAPLLFDELEPSQLNTTSKEFISPDDGYHSDIISSNDEKRPQHLLKVGIVGDEDHETRLALPTLHKSVSNQSISSVASVGSESAHNSNTASITTGTKKRVLKGAVCHVCNKFISRDLTRHMRIHNEIGRFQCVYPKHMCNHKTQNFNRPYDYKKHLLHRHFIFDKPEGKSANKLTDKLPITGACSACGARFVASEWLDDHILTKDLKKRCAYVEET
ncbi:unnamed protein product [Candida verbasci]|uniref:Uncharacterized protein n=1 Tax=Candida verbasci TaxID=1227364 RepID=A0A9W4TZP3_9ASCO|nr:unnamed protein product [Candida verbasci]